MASICQKIGSYLPAFTQKNFERGVVAGMLVQGTLMGMPLFALAELGVCLSLKLSQHLCLRKRKCVVLAPPKEIGPLVPLSSGVRSRLDVSTRLFCPNGPPTNIVWRENSCFCSSPFWAFLTNEPAVLSELPEAIARRLNEQLLFPNGTNFFKLAFLEQRAALNAIFPILRKKESILLSDFNTVREALKQLECFGFPEGANQDALKSLLSLLELHHLIRDFQTSPSLSGDRINELREMTYRVSANFKDRGRRLGDAHELFQPLADLIFEGSGVQQVLKTVRIGQALELVETKSSWGDFLLPMPSPQKRESIQSLLAEHLSPQDPVSIQYGPLRETLNVVENTQFEKTPPFLVLTLNRGQQNIPYKRAVKVDNTIPKSALLTTEIPSMNMAPVAVEERLALRNGQIGSYQLVGVSRRRSDLNHYDAILRRPDGSWYFCDDRKNPSVQPMNSSDVSRYAQTGYIFFYRLSNNGMSN